MATNQTTYYWDIPARTIRIGEVTGADWTGGLNTGGSCANGVGVNTGNFDPKPEDWPRITPSVIQNSQIIGGTASPLNSEDAQGALSRLSFVQAAAPVAPDAAIDTVATVPFLNRTGQTIPADSWAWGVGAPA